jgi:ribosomal protein S18 acetylase RimI-like enzyme
MRPSDTPSVRVAGTDASANSGCNQNAAAAELLAAEFRRRAPAFELRPTTPDDEPFLRRLFFLTQAEIVPQPALLLQMQYDSRRFAYDIQYPGAMDLVVWRGSAPIGRLLSDWIDREIVDLIDLAVAPDDRGGAAALHLMRAATTVADRLGRTLDLSVRPGAAVANLYLRLGFAPLSKDETPVRMRRPPRTPPKMPQYNSGSQHP